MKTFLIVLCIIMAACSTASKKEANYWSGVAKEIGKI